MHAWAARKGTAGEPLPAVSVLRAYLLDPVEAEITPVQLDESVHEVVLMADEYLGARVVMQFDLTGIDEIASGCGLAVYEKR